MDGVLLVLLLGYERKFPGGGCVLNPRSRVSGLYRLPAWVVCTSLACLACVFADVCMPMTLAYTPCQEAVCLLAGMCCLKTCQGISVAPSPRTYGSVAKQCSRGLVRVTAHGPSQST
jgi:hypothetical protein